MWDCARWCQGPGAGRNIRVYEAHSALGSESTQLDGCQTARSQQINNRSILMFL